MRKFLKNLLKNRKGQGLVEYAFIVAGVAFICLLALSIFGHKLSDQYSIMAGMLPGAHAEDNTPVASMEFLSSDVVGGVQVGTGGISWNNITGNSGTDEGLNNNVLTIGENGGDAFVGD